MKKTLSKEDLVADTWYTNYHWNTNSFAKLISTNKTSLTFYFKEALVGLSYYNEGDWYLYNDGYTAMTDEQKIKFLPKDHADYPKQELTVNTFEIW